MAHSLSAKKRIRQNAKRRAANRANKSTMRTQVKKCVDMARTGADGEAIDREMRVAQQKLDRLAVKGTIHKNTAARKKSRLAQMVNALKEKAN